MPTTDSDPPKVSWPGWRGDLGFRLIGLMKVSSGLMLALAGFGIIRMMNRDIGESLQRVVIHLHLDPDNWLVHETVSRISGIDHAHLKALGIGTFFYALLHFVEGTGLFLLKPWAEYLTVIMTGSLLPLEVYEIARRQTSIRCVVFGVNLAIFVYILVKIRQQHAHRASKN